MEPLTMEPLIILVTGGSGLFGSAVREHVEKEASDRAAGPSSTLPSTSTSSVVVVPARVPPSSSTTAPSPWDAEQRWVFLSSKDADLRDRDQTFAAFARAGAMRGGGGSAAAAAGGVPGGGEGEGEGAARRGPTHVLHLAAYVGGLFKNMREKVEFYRYNAQINDNVLEACRVYGAQKCVSCLSTCIFPDKTAYPIDESMVHDGPPHPSNEGYAYAKRMVDVLSRAYSEEYPGGCRYTTLVPTNLYGPRDNFSLDGGHVLPCLAHRALLAQRAGADLTVWGSGAPLRQFLHSADAAALAVWAMREYNGDPRPLILAPDAGDEVSIAELAGMVARGTRGFLKREDGEEVVVQEKGEGQAGDGLVMGGRSRVLFDSSKADGQQKKTASNAKLRALLPPSAFRFRPLEEGVAEVCAWLEAHYDEARK